MSTDGSGNRCPRDNNRPFDLYSALFQPEAQLDNRQHSHRRLLPNVPIMHHYRQQFLQYQQEKQNLVSNQLVQASPQDKQSTSSHLNQHFAQLLISGQTLPQDQHLASSQLDQISPNDHFLMSSRSDERSPPAQHMMSSQPDQMSPHSQQLMSSQPDQLSPHSQQLMSSQPDQMSPHSQQLMSSQPNQMSLLAQQLMSRQANQSSLQLFRGQANYPQNTPHLQQSAQSVTVNLDSPSFVFDQLYLHDSASILLRSEQLATSESLIEQREHDLNVFSTAGNSSRNQSQNVFPNNLRAPKNFDALMPEQGSPSLMLDNLITTKNSRSTRNVTPPVITSASMWNHNCVLNPSSSCHDMPSTSHFYTLPLSSNDASVAGPSMNSMIHAGHFPPKLERQDFHTAEAGNSNIPEASIWQNQPSENFSPDRFTTERAFLESSSSVANVPLVNANSGSTSLIYPERRAPKRSYDQSSTEPQHRRTSECSTSSGTSSSGAASSGSVSLENPVAAPTNKETNNNGEVVVAGDSKDPTYLEKRRKNNESAKKSREARRLKEKSLFSDVFKYHQEVVKCTAELSALHEENRRLRQHLGIFGGFDAQAISGLYQFAPQPTTFDKQEHF